MQLHAVLGRLPLCRSLLRARCHQSGTRSGRLSPRLRPAVFQRQARVLTAVPRINILATIREALRHEFDARTVGGQAAQHLLGRPAVRRRHLDGRGKHVLRRVELQVFREPTHEIVGLPVVGESEPNLADVLHFSDRPRLEGRRLQQPQIREDEVADILDVVEAFLCQRHLHLEVRKATELVDTRAQRRGVACGLQGRQQ
mmetsp:Transcript_54340/g.137773  ORF Transcript_54340/g.137773 Transcript_54340/m.137773 type:complete len:200 (-) Transcript_54340:241-840(-)